MSIQSPAFVPGNNLPAPVTSGTTIQTFTDVNGEQWVAKNGVAGGAWKRARDALFAVAYRAAAYTTPTALTVFPYDTLRNDNYGMWTGASSGFTLGAGGWWLCQAMVRGNSNGASNYMQGQIQYNGVGASSDNVLLNTAVGLMWRTQCLLLMPAGTVINCAVYQSPAGVAINAGLFNRLEVMYLGSG